MQDWPRNDQVLRIDWNVAPNTTFYSPLQFGYEKRAGGVSLLGAPAAGRRSTVKYEIDTFSYREHAAAHVQQHDVLGVHDRRELVAPVRRRRLTQDGTDAQPACHGAAGSCRSSSRTRTR